MGYKGETHRINCSRGGMSGNDNIDEIPDYMMIHPTKNINLHKDGRSKRFGTSHHLDSAYADTPQVMGVYQFKTWTGSAQTIGATKDGKIYKDATNTIKTGLSTTNFFDFESFANELYICDGENVPQTWDGAAASTSDLTTPPSDWSGTNYPQFLFKHGRGNSERMLYGGCPTNPTRIYISKDGDAKDPGDANGVQIDIETADGLGIQGGIEYGDRAIFFGKRKAYVLDDTNADTANWGYEQAQWEGGAANFRLITKTPNDIVCMTEDGEVYSVTAAETYGDYKAASLTRPSFMDQWIRNEVDLSKIDQFHMSYDPRIRALRVFVVRNGQTQVDTCMCYFIDRPLAEAWSIHDNQSSVSGMSASASCIARDAVGSYKVYTGDYAGMVWETGSATYQDNTAAYKGGFKSGNQNFNEPRTDKLYKRGWIIAEPAGAWNLSIDMWIDGAAYGSTPTVSLAGTGGLLDSFVLGTSVLGGDDVITATFDINRSGKRIQFEVYNSGTNQDFFVSQMMVDWKPLGKRSE